MKLNRELIVDAGMRAFAERGYVGLSMRQIADALGVHAGSLYYHVKNKEQLLALLADRVAGEAYDAGTAALGALSPAASWEERIEAQLVALRASLLARTGAPALLAASPAVLSPAALALMERLLRTLDAAGVAPDTRPVAADTLLSYVTGFVLQEQAPPADVQPPADLAERYPMTVAGAGSDPDTLFRTSIRLLCAGIATDRTPVR
ncbi:TetR/AcrR family transcriptional regulator [Cryptosporangium arvum]|uniref:Transcriptional regulator n=1 Tax=Cryptosporangium arvum DSM 44712 TaxID=927661 RepID=A0A010Z693_9ACTN|nr:TetR/AcrR family transcriptional regulator [Cryptosporangium arvum]EXG82813.1 transcriptional regulator [Cryptosporangium arvum DSM 44712]